MSELPGSKRCQKCGKAVGDADLICTNCGTHLGTGLNVQTVAGMKTAGRTTIALIICGIAAVICGAIWAAVAVLTGYQIGFVAWGVGLACGFTVCAAAKQNHPALGVAAAALSVIGLLIGKIGIALFFDFGGEYPFLARLLAVFSLWDILWFGLALASAYKLGASGELE